MRPAPRKGEQAEPMGLRRRAWRRHSSPSTGRHGWEQAPWEAATVGNVGWVGRKGVWNGAALLRSQGACSAVKKGGVGGPKRKGLGQGKGQELGNLQWEVGEPSGTAASRAQDKLHGHQQPGDRRTGRPRGIVLSGVPRFCALHGDVQPFRKPTVCAKRGACREERMGAHISQGDFRR